MRGLAVPVSGPFAWAVWPDLLHANTAGYACVKVYRAVCVVVTCDFALVWLNPHCLLWCMCHTDCVLRQNWLLDTVRLPTPPLTLCTHAGYTRKVTGNTAEERLDMRAATKSDKFCK